jgi:hypothetical protein
VTALTPDHHLVALLTKVLHELFSDESAAADDDNFHVVLLI